MASLKSYSTSHKFCDADYYVIMFCLQKLGNGYYTGIKCYALCMICFCYHTFLLSHGMLILPLKYVMSELSLALVKLSTRKSWGRGRAFCCLLYQGNLFGC